MLPAYADGRAGDGECVAVPLIFFAEGVSLQIFQKVYSFLYLDSPIKSKISDG